MSQNKTMKNGSKKSSSATSCKTYSRGKLGERIFETTKGFSLADPNTKLMDMQYNNLHDPHLKHFFNWRGKKQRLKKLGLITNDNKVLCTLKEFREYMRYRETFNLSCEKHLLEEQKQLLKKFMMLKQKGEIPDISISDMNDWLIRKGMDTFRKMYRQNIKPDNPYHDEMLWKIRQRLQLEKMEKEVMRELRPECRFQQDRKTPLKKPVRTAWTSKVCSSSSFFPRPALQTIYEETEESSLELSCPEFSAGSTGLVGVINEVTSESPGKSADVLDEMSAIFDSRTQKSTSSSTKPSGSSSPLSAQSPKSSKDQIQTAVLEELNKFVTEISTATLMLDTEYSKNPSMDDTELKKDIEVVTLDDPTVQPSTSQVESSSVQPHISEDIMKLAVDRLMPLLSQIEATLPSGSSEALETGADTLESKNLKSAVLSEMMVKDMVKEWVHFKTQQNMSSREEVQPRRCQSPQSDNQLSREVRSDLSSDGTAESSYCPSEIDLASDLVRAALDRVSLVISEKKPLFCEQKSDEASIVSRSSSSSSLEESDGSDESTNDSSKPVRLRGGNLPCHLSLDRKTVLSKALHGIQQKIARGDFSDWVQPTVSPENVGMIMDLITDLVKVSTMEEDLSDAHSSESVKEMENTPADLGGGMTEVPPSPLSYIPPSPLSIEDETRLAWSSGVPSPDTLETHQCQEENEEGRAQDQQHPPIAHGQV
ncbi:hypothetical protein QTP70_018120 [Hemibagrus guttatus]|uniref:Fibrous sheath-interacting protein 2 n=1 Tax=Hemibagrus guttatus TaxID=175788 RepID=A0AAE0PQ96_9TELE|nr:hypothetical protein QTP70_018120 [Hemibagrus guttatus]